GLAGRRGAGPGGARAVPPRYKKPRCSRNPRAGVAPAIKRPPRAASAVSLPRTGSRLPPRPAPAPQVMV
ncbi:hypothetical protein DV515_00013931, partial [Chloebia gouldiae]